jgi:hypothetical protein
MILDDESDIQGLKVEFTGLKIIDSNDKEIIWWSLDHSRELKGFARSNLNTELFSAKLKIYVESFKIEEDKDKARVYITMLHQLYFEILEYEFLLLKSFVNPIEILPVSMSKPSTSEIIGFAEKISKDNQIKEVDGKTQIFGPLISLAEKTAKYMGISEKYREIVILSIYFMLNGSTEDFLDVYHRNVYNSIKHGNRGKSSGGNLAISNKDEEKTNLFDTDYSFDHSKIVRINNDKTQITLKPIATFIDSEQLIKRCEIILSYINVIHSIYIRAILDEDPNEYIHMYDQEVVQKAWSGTDKNGHMFDRNIAKFTIKDQDNLNAEVFLNLSMDIKVRFPIKYSSPIYEEMKMHQKTEEPNADTDY